MRVEWSRVGEGKAGKGGAGTLGASCPDGARGTRQGLRARAWSSATSQGWPMSTGRAVAGKAQGADGCSACLLGPPRGRLELGKFPDAPTPCFQARSVGLRRLDVSR